MEHRLAEMKVMMTMTLRTIMVMMWLTMSELILDINSSKHDTQLQPHSNSSVSTLHQTTTTPGLGDGLWQTKHRTQQRRRRDTNNKAPHIHVHSKIIRCQLLFVFLIGSYICFNGFWKLKLSIIRIFRKFIICMFNHLFQYRIWKK